MNNLVEQEKNEKDLTPRQQAFLEAFFGEAQYDVLEAKKIAGYAKNSNTKDIIRPLRKYIEEAINDQLAVGAAKGVGTLINILHDPTKPGNKERIAAANSLLDRFGVTKEKASQVNVNVEVAPVVYLPEKKEVTIDKEDYIDITDS